MRLKLLYFASLRDRAGRDAETIESQAADPRALYAEVDARHGLGLAPERLRVAVNGQFATWQSPLADGDEVVFLPPVSGG
jgi:molybdopterin synthase sulfur carrier subunit